MTKRPQHTQTSALPKVLGALLILISAYLPTAMYAQGSTGAGNSAARWGLSEFYIGGAYMGGGSNSLENSPIELDFDDDWGLTLGGGYHLSNHLYVGGELLFAKSTFSGTSTEDDTSLQQSMRQWGITGGFEYNLLEGPLTPYLSAGLGFTYLETDDPTRDPAYICRPGFYGWWCDWYYPVYSDWFFTYYAGVGLRWDISDRSVVRLSYKLNWISASGVTSQVRQDMLAITYGGKF